MSDVRELFQREKARFGKSTEFAIAVSKSAAGRKVNIPNVMASYVFTRVCVGADSLRHLLERDFGESEDSTLDHYSTSVLARNIVEASMMVHYLLEDGVSDAEWVLRGKILDLHNATLKLRLFKSIGAKEEYEMFKAEMTTLRDEIKQHPAFKSIDETRQERILAGHEQYVGGLRSTLKLVGLEVDYFDGMYAYLSAQVHISPSSFYETDRRLNFGHPADYQYYLASYALAHARMFLLRSATRLVESDATVAEKVDAEVLQSMRDMAKIPFSE